MVYVSAMPFGFRTGGMKLSVAGPKKVYARPKGLLHIIAKCRLASSKAIPTGIPENIFSRSL